MLFVLCARLFCFVWFRCLLDCFLACLLSSLIVWVFGFLFVGLFVCWTVCRFVFFCCPRPRAPLFACKVRMAFSELYSKGLLLLKRGKLFCEFRAGWCCKSASAGCCLGLCDAIRLTLCLLRVPFGVLKVRRQLLVVLVWQKQSGRWAQCC